MVLDELLIFVSNLSCSLISSSKLFGPFLIPNLSTTSRVLSNRGRCPKAVFSFTHVVWLTTGNGLCIQSCVEFKILLGSLDYVVHLSFRGETSNDLVLRWHVQFLHHSVKFLAEFRIFAVKFGERSILLGKQESQILHLVH